MKMRKIVKESVDMFMGNIPGARFTLGWRMFPMTIS